LVIYLIPHFLYLLYSCLSSNLQRTSALYNSFLVLINL